MIVALTVGVMVVGFSVALALVCLIGWCEQQFGELEDDGIRTDDEGDEGDQGLLEPGRVEED